MTASQRIMYDLYLDLKVSVLDGNLRQSGSEFQRTLAEYTGLDFKRSKGQREREANLLVTYPVVLPFLAGTSKALLCRPLRNKRLVIDRRFLDCHAGV